MDFGVWVHIIRLCQRHGTSKRIAEGTRCMTGSVCVLVHSDQNTKHPNTGRCLGPINRIRLMQTKLCFRKGVGGRSSGKHPLLKPKQQACQRKHSVV